MKIFYLSIFLLMAICSFGQKSLHIYGGKGHDIYLGCINCDSYNTNSIWNEYGTYGNSYNSKSIWNDYGSFGSEYSNTSPFNSYASDPPVIVDKDGGFYGYFTVNEYRSKRSTLKIALVICRNYELIRDDVSGWYEKIFK